MATLVQAPVVAPPSPERLREVWETRPGLAGVLGTVDHKEIGKRYMATAFVFFLLGGLEATLLRTQLIRPDNAFLGPATYNQLFTMHGTTMIFLFATPMLSGFGNFLLPLLLGARDMAFPRLNAFGYWVFLFAGLFLYASFLTGSAPDGGWFAYAPLTGPRYSPGPNLDFWGLGILFLGISSTTGAINFIVSIFKTRAPGMSLNRMPLFAWNVLVMAFSILFAMPPLTASLVFLELERKFGFHFFDPQAGGNPVLWQHLFWVFGHPDVYIIFLPAVGMVSEIVPTFARRRIVGYTFISMATVATGIIAFGVWAHHMFAIGLSLLTMSFFAVASTMIVIPSGVQVFAWLATLWYGRPVVKTPLLFVIGFLIVFVVGGLTGPMFAAVPFDWQATDTYFVVAHFHYVLFGGAVFPIFGGLYYWLPKMSGRLLDERLGTLSFWLIFVGFNLTFFPMHITGLLGMPRRIYTYQPGLGWDWLNAAETIGAYVLGLGVLVTMWNVWHSVRGGGQPAGDNPWGASTLEWATSSPPPPYNFRVIPTVRSRDPLWDQASVFEPGHDVNGHRVTVGTTTLVARPETLLPMPEDSAWPLVAAVGLALLFVGLFADLLLVALLGGLIVAAGCIGWLWPIAPPEGSA